MATSSAGSERELVARLMEKVSEQALELSELSAQLESSRQILAEESFAIQAKSPDGEKTQHSHTDNFRATLGSTMASTSEAAVQRRMEKDHNLQMLALQRQLEITETKLAENIKAKKKFMQDLDAKTREASFYAKKCNDVQMENQQLRHQVEQTLKMTSMTAKARGVKQPMKSVDSITYFKTCDELKQLEATNEQLKKDLDDAKEREAQFRMRVKVLEEALEFRSEEIGLAGHSDLLAKVAKLRGEVTALKNELTSKHQKIAEVEDNKADLSSRHETLQRHVAQLQQRLSQSQQEMYRLQNGDMGEMLKQAESERDRLLQFVQSDMNKSTSLARQVEQLEAELRAVRKTESSAGETSARYQAALESEAVRFRHLEERFNSAIAQIKEMQQANQVLEAEKTALTNQFNRKSTEADELNRMQMNLFVQNQSKDEELKKKSEEIQQLRAQLRELELSAPNVESENVRLRERLQFVQDEVSILRDSVNVMEPKLARIEPELNMLRNEREDWHSERLQMDAELSKLRPLGRILMDLSSELVQLNDLANKANGNGTNSLNMSQTTISPNKSIYDQGVSLSQRHSLWVGLPSLRSLNATLYENIRRMAHDLHTKETHCSELIAKLQHITAEMDTTSRTNETQWQQLTRQQETANQTINRLSDLVSSTERELSALRSNRITVDQIRTVLASYPGDFLENRLRDILRNGVDAGVDASVLDRSSEIPDESYQESKHHEPLTSGTYTPSIKQHNSHNHSQHNMSSTAMRSAGVGSPEDRHSGYSGRESMESMLNRISDHALPDLIGRAIMHNANAVLELQTVKDKLVKLEREHARLTEEFNTLSRLQIDYDNLVHEQQEKLTNGEARLQALQRECFEKVEGATELAEKQNALTMTLEAKIEKLHKEKQLRSAQLTALQQREESFRVRLLSSLQEYCLRVKVAAPPDSTKLVELLHYNAEILRSRTGSLLDSNTLHYSITAPSMTHARTASPSSYGVRHQGHSATLEEASSTRTKPKISKRSSTGGRVSSGKRSNSTSPEQATNSAPVVLDRENIRTRLSPTSQRFLSESHDFSTSSSAVRRLPSPVTHRGRVDSSFGALHSPGVESTLQHSFGVTSIDDLATSRMSGRSLHSSRTSPNTTNRTIERSSSNQRSASRSQVSSTSAVLQERLREAQKAFAAMRESHQY